MSAVQVRLLAYIYNKAPYFFRSLWPNLFSGKVLGNDRLKV
ncbi:MAG: hypothetical protein O4808_15890 [Trichodesmium sp. St17_bin3_1_1]|nr:hypothetical protein [Trichodesmium sp. St17_bin3_1_1]